MEHAWLFFAVVGGVFAFKFYLDWQFRRAETELDRVHAKWLKDRENGRSS